MPTISNTNPARMSTTAATAGPGLPDGPWLPGGAPFPPPPLATDGLELGALAGLAATDGDDVAETGALELPVDVTGPDGLNTMFVTGCSSTALGATPVCPCSKSKNPTPVTRTGTFTVAK